MDTIFDHIELLEDFLAVLKRNKVSVGDVKYFQAYREYLQRRFVDKDLYYNCVDELSKKYGLGEVKFWYEPFSDGYKMFSVQICPDHSDDERIEVLDKITDEMRDFAKKNNMERFFAYSCVLYDYDVE